MRFQPHTLVRQLLFPNGLLVLTCLITLTFFVDLAPYQQTARVLSLLIVIAAAMLAVRLHSLRAFLALLSMLAQLLFLRFGPSDPYVLPCAVALVAIDFALILLVEDLFFDWQAVIWWLGLLLVQWSALLAAVQWAPSVPAAMAAMRFNLPFANIGVLEAGLAFIILLLALRFIASPDAIGSGLLWALVALAASVKYHFAAEAYASIAGFALCIAVIERSHWIAYHDELTTLSGRRAFNEALASLKDDYCIAIADVDHFKKFNDSFGHDTGDQVLRKVAKHLADVDGGSAFRCGGEEFAIIFTDRGLADAKEICEELRHNIEQDDFVARGPARSERQREDRRGAETRRKQSSPVRTDVTISIGLAEAAEGQDADGVVKAADKALYQAKKLGRNRVEAAMPRRRRANPATKKVPASNP